MTLKTAYIKSNPHFDSKVSASDQKSNLKKRRQEKTDDENGFSFCNPVACENSPNKSKDMNQDIVGVVIHNGNKSVLIKQGYLFDLRELQFLNEVVQSCHCPDDVEKVFGSRGVNWDYTQQCYYMKKKKWIIGSQLVKSLCYLGINLTILPIFHRKVSRRYPMSSAFTDEEDWKFFQKKLASISPRRTSSKLESFEEIYEKTIYERLDAS
ncbi:uncharacterized protein LOC142348100 [Convolutriloba macropyga]|uniref:uncharacterized protein LOC142348100 n=1 Tax=Convolutriloba macropyga TaxID=536237 RepID=UPI003F51F91B